MKNLVVIFSFFLCFTVVADGHKDSEKTMKDKFMNNPNYLLDFKTCKEVKDGVFGLLINLSFIVFSLSLCPSATTGKHRKKLNIIIKFFINITSNLFIYIRVHFFYKSSKKCLYF